MDLSHGMARTIFAALKNFAEQSGHNDLSDSKLILLGFSGTGLLFAHALSHIHQIVWSRRYSLLLAKAIRLVSKRSICLMMRSMSPSYRRWKQ